MKMISKKLPGILTSAMVLSAIALPASAAEIENKLVLIHTNDIHCDVDRNIGYDGVAAYRDLWEEEIGEDYVLLLDAGDVVQGGPLGTLTEGQALIDIMNSVGYDYFAPGNHEFDYGMEQGLYLMDQLTATVLSANFIDLKTGESVYAGYDVRDFGDVQIGFVGVTTPETLTKATPAYFQDEDGEFIYSLGQNDTAMYDYVQAAIDACLDEGADFIVGIGHMGIEDSAAPWRSTDLIENTVGFQLFLDGHSHTMDAGTEVLDMEGNVVIVNQAGSRFDAVGEVIIDLDTLEFTVGYVDEDFSEKERSVTAVMREINEKFEEIMTEIVAETDVDLLMSVPETGDYLVRNQETNLGNLLADAFRIMMDADIGLANGGGTRANIMAGDITYEDIISVQPFGNETTSISISGQTLVDSLEMGARYTPDSSGGFMSVSGMTYEINTTIESSVVVDEAGNFDHVDGEYRVQNVKVAGKALDYDAMYTVASNDYILQDFGDGMAMFTDAEVVKDRTMIDNEMLILFIKDYLGGVIGEEYADVEGRIVIITEEVTEEVETEEVEPEEVEPEVVEPEVVEPEVVEPEVVVPEVVVPEVVVPEVVEPEVVEPEVATGRYVVKNGDNLSHIARDLLGSANRWNEIYEANRDIIKDPNWIYIGQEFVIPAA
ncbi:MAG: 5'-nucleotidase C-terminal domain-containing protein [Eubacteriales bacterium]